MKPRPGNAQHQGARDAQQDSFGFSDLEDRAFVRHAGSLGVVADGMGGLAHGGAAGAAAVRAVLRAYAAKHPGEGIADALLRAVRDANEAVLQLARAAGQPDDVGTTVAAIVVHEAWLYWIAAGDTRVYLWRDGALTQVTADHVYAAELDVKVAAGQLSEQEARKDPDRDALTSHLGTARLRAIDRSVRPFPLLEGDRVLVCSDGLYRALTADEMAAPLADAPQRACETLVKRALAKQLARQDNLTAIVIALDADGVTTATTSTRSGASHATSEPAVTNASTPSRAESGTEDGAAQRDNATVSDAGDIVRRLWRRLLRHAAPMMILALCVALSIAGAPRAARADDLDSVPSGVVHLFVISPSGSISTGSGFLINDTSTIITNHHVIASSLQDAFIFVMSEQEASKLAPQLRGEGKTSRDVYQYAVDHLPRAKVAWSDPAKDLAIVTPSGAVAGRPLSLTSGSLVHVGDRVVAFGFPGLNRAMGPASLVTLDRRPGEITSQHVESARNRGVYATSANTYQGMSGGPAVNACGEVLGVVVGGFSRPVTNEKGESISTETVTIFIQTDTLIQELQAHSVPFKRATSRCETGGSGVPGVLPSRDPVLTGGVLAALLMGVAALGLAVTKRGRNAVRAATDSVSRRMSRSGSPGAAPAVRAKTPARTPPPFTPPSMPAPSSSVPSPSRNDGAIGVLYGLAGEYDGIELELSDEPLAIGRDPRVSHLVFPPSASSISGRHCAVWFDREARAAMVEDFWSTNGTYLADGRRLEGGVPQPLQSSERFYLGDPGVLFEVRY